MAPAGWADLPPELLSIISGCLQKPIDVFNFRHVCRSWRFSSSPPPRNNLSPYFPLTAYSPLSKSEIMTIHATAVFLLRHRSDPSKPWLVSVQESVAGNLVPRHALTHKKIGGNNYLLDLSSDDWISATRISRSFEYENGRKVAFVTPLVGVRKTGPKFLDALISFRLNKLSNNGVSSRFEMHIDHCYPCKDFAKWNGRIYGVDYEGNMYVFDKASSYGHKIPVFLRKKSEYSNHLVVSDGDLYMVSGRNVVRLVRDDKRDQWRWEEVDDLGDKVFFITKNCSFSVLARDLPPPWKPNCIVTDHRNLIELGFDGRRIWSLPGHCELFDPPCRRG